VKKHSATDRTINGLMWLGSGVGGQVVVQIIVLMILARLLTPAEYGIVTASVVISGLGLIFTEIGIGPSIVQRKTISDSHIRAGFLMSVLLGGLMAYLINSFKVEISEFFNIKELSEVIPYLALIYLLRGISVVSESLLQRALQFKKIAIIDFVSYSAGYGITGVALAYAGYSFWALIYAQLAQVAIKSLLLFFYRKIPFLPVLSLAPYKELMNFGLGFTIARIANYLANQSDKFVISRYLGGDALGLYGRAYQLAIMPINVIARILDQVTFPILSGVQDDEIKLRAGYEKLLISASFMALPISCLLYIVSDELILVVLGEQWRSVITIFQIMVVGLLFRLVYRISDSILKALGKVYKRALRQLVYALFVLLFSYIGSAYGVDGVAYGVLAAVIINSLMMVQLCIKETNNSWLGIIGFVFYGYRLAVLASIPVFLTDLILTYLGFVNIVNLLVLLFVWLASILFIIKYLAEFIFKESGMSILYSILNLLPIRIKNILSVSSVL